jgi:hypothetical protein
MFYIAMVLWYGSEGRQTVCMHVSVSWGAVRLSLLGMSATIRPIVSALDDRRKKTVEQSVE